MDTLHRIHRTDPATLADQRLRWVLRANVATSTVAGVVAAVAPRWLDDVLGTGHPGWVRVVGLGLLVFAVEVLLVSRAERSRLVEGTGVVVLADVAWVVATIATIALGWYSTSGAIVMGVAGIGVADFAIVQHLLRRRLAA